MVRSFVLATTLLLVAPAIAAAQAPGLKVVAPDNLALTRDGATTKPATVWVSNSTEKAAIPSFDALLEDSDANSEPYSVEVVDGGGDPVDQAASIPAGKVVRYRLALRSKTRRGEPEDATGELVVTGAGAPDSVPVSAKTKLLGDRGVTAALLLPIVPAVLLVLWSGFLVLRKENSWGTPLPSDLNFKEGFASNITAAGALLTLIAAAGVLPEETASLSKEAFAALALVFGVGVATAGLVYGAFQQDVWVPVDKDPEKEQLKRQGTVGTFLVASLVTVWAVFGQLLLAQQMLEELGQDQGFSVLALWTLRILVFLAAITMIVYTVRRVPMIVASERNKSTEPDAKLQHRYNKATQAGIVPETATRPATISLL